MLESARATAPVARAEPVSREAGPPSCLLVGVVPVLADQFFGERDRPGERALSLRGGCCPALPTP